MYIISSVVVLIRNSSRLVPSHHNGDYAKNFFASRPKHTTSANVVLPGFCVVGIEPDVETVDTEAEVAPDDAAVGEVPVPVMVEVINIEWDIVIVVVPVVVVARR